MFYYTFPEAREPGESETVYTVAMGQLDQYFTPQVNVPYLRHLFRIWLSHLLKASISLSQGFVKGQNTANSVIEKYMSSRLRRKLLEKRRGLTLAEQLQNTARSIEASDRQAGAIENPNLNDKEGLKEGLNSVQEKPEGMTDHATDVT